MFFQPGLNVITGETGVGKSLLLEAIGSLFGGQHNKLPVRTGCDKAVVEAEFALIEDTLLQHWLEKNDLAVELPIILRREFYRNGRTRFFINDSPANLGLAAELGDWLIELHGQHEVISLFDHHKQLELLDSYANDSGRLRSYQKCFKELISLREELATLRKRIDDSQAGRDTLRLQLEELENLNPQPGEIVAIETNLVRLENSEKIFQTCSDICDRLNEAPDSAIEKLSEIRDWLPELIEYYPALKGWGNEIDNTRSVLVELNRSLLELARKLQRISRRQAEDGTDRLGDVGQGIGQSAVQSVRVSDTWRRRRPFARHDSVCQPVEVVGVHIYDIVVVRGEEMQRAQNKREGHYAEDSQCRQPAVDPARQWSE